jgi:ribonuclease BN (tRNA processing enzyme)
LKIEILGTRGEVKPKSPYHSRHSGVLLDQFVLLDLGEREFLGYDPKYIFVTHLHPDHAFFVNDPIDIETPLYGPEKYARIPNMKALSSRADFNGYRITPIPTHHSKLVKSTAYLIQKGQHRVLYTGDMIWINKEYHHVIEGLDLVIADGSFIRKGGMIRRDKKTGQIYGHNGIPDLVQLFKRFCGNIVFVHFGSWFYRSAEQARKKLKTLGNENGVLVRSGYDGMRISL